MSMNMKNTVNAAVNTGAKRNNGAGVAGADGSRKFCGHCKKLGKTEREYTSHFPRASLDAKSPVTCPEILKTECTHCHELGHWVSYCPTLKMKIREDKKTEHSRKIQQHVSKPAAMVRMTTGSKFAVLGGLVDSSSSDDELEEAAVTVVEEFPVLGGSGGCGAGGHTGLSFIDAIKKPVAVVKQVICGGRGGGGGDVGVCVPLVSAAFASAAADRGKRVRFDVCGGSGGMGGGILRELPSTKRLIMTEEGVPRIFRNGHYMTRWADDSSSSDEEEDPVVGGGGVVVGNDAW